VTLLFDKTSSFDNHHYAAMSTTPMLAYLQFASKRVSEGSVTASSIDWNGDRGVFSTTRTSPA
jgi:hypothetical protein